MAEVVVKGAEPSSAAEGSVRDRISNIMSQSMEKTEAKERGETSEPEEEDNTAEFGEEEAVDEKEENDEPVKKSSRAQERIQQLITERDTERQRVNQMQATLDMYKPLLEKALNPQSSVKAEEPKSLLPKEQYDSQEEYARAIVDVIGNVLNEKLTPINQELATTKFKAQVNNWFSNNQDAIEVKGQMEKLADSFAPEDVAVYQKQILKGNTFILDALYKIASASSKKQDNDLIKDSIRADQKKVVSSSAKKSTKSTSRVQSRDTYSQAKKGKPSDWLAEQFLQLEKRKD